MSEVKRRRLLDLFCGPASIKEEPRHGRARKWLKTKQPREYKTGTEL